MVEDRPISQPAASRRWYSAVEVVFVFAVFFVHAAWPVPDVNEAHYLTKAKHYWDPAYCAGDFFLETADAHLVFYWTFGWLSKWLSLEALAWTGRVATWALMAWAWRRLSVAVLPYPGVAVLSAALFVCLNERAHMAGEWVVGGFEAKGFAYVLVLLGLEAIVRGRWQQVWLLLGAASAFHVLVGGWATVAAAIAWRASPSERAPLKLMLPSLGAGLLLAGFGLWPAISLTAGVPSAIAAQANQIYVYERLPHHLVPSTFKEGFIARHVLMACLWGVLCGITPAPAGQKRLRWFVAGAMMIAAAGFCIAWLGDIMQGMIGGPARQLQASLLRYYWFRLSDAAVPVGLALTGLSFIYWLHGKHPRIASWWMTAAVIVSGAYLGDRLLDGVETRVPRADKNLAYDDWIDICRWARNYTSPEAKFFIPRGAATFKWYAGRGDVVSWKDVPQDAEGLVEWWRRFREIYQRDPKTTPPRWYDSPGQLGEQRLAELGAKYRAEFAIAIKTPLTPPLKWQPEYENASYAVYRVGNKR